MCAAHQTGRLAPQSLLRGRYLIVEMVGQGGMGSVYKATDTRARHRVVAVKEMSQGYLSPDRLTEAQERFRLEAKILGQLSHPNLPRVYDSFDEAGRSYLVMDFIEGKTLLQLLNEQPEQRLPVDQVLRYALQLCDVLAYLHQRSSPIIFRDLKPSNVMIATNGHVYLIDFGIARVFKQGQQLDTTFFGSQGFSPPEQFGVQQTSPRSDLYSLGATLHFCLTGKNPLTNKPTLFDFRPVRDYNPRVPTDFDELIQWLVATREEQRPASAEQVRHALQAINQWASGATSELNGNGIAPTQKALYYDTKTARATQSLLWLTRSNRLPGQLGIWWASAIIPFLANIYGEAAAWFVLSCLPFLKQISGKGSQRMSVWISSLSRYHFTAIINSFAPPVWAASFVTLFLLLPVVTIGGSFYMLNVQHTIPPIVMLFLSVLLFLITLIASANKQLNSLARSILLATALGMLTIIVALQSLPDVQQSMKSITLNQVLGSLIIIIAVVSLLRPTDRFSWVDHLAIAAIAIAGALLQLIFGKQVLQQLFPQSSIGYTAMNLILVGTLGAVAVISLLRFSRPFARTDSVLLLIVASIYMGLQYAFGLQEIQAILFLPNTQEPATSSLNLVLLNLVLIGTPAVGALLWLFLVQNSSSVSRVPLLLLALASAPLQNYLGTLLGGVQPTFYTKLLSIKVLDFQDINQLIAYGLVLCALLLLFRLGSRFTGLDRVMIFYIAIACAFLQGSAWDNGQPQLAQLSFSAINLPQIYLVAINELVARILMVIVVSGLLLATIVIFLRVGREYAWVDRMVLNLKKRFQWFEKFVLRLDHVMVLVVTIACILLQIFFGSHTPIVVTSSDPQTALLLSQTITLVLIIAAIIALFRLSRPFNWTDRLIVLIDAIICIPLLLSGQTNLLSYIQRWIGTPHIPTQFATIGLFVATLVSLVWLKRSFPRGDRDVLLIIFSIALICALLQALGYTFALIALVMLIQGVLLATQIERVR